MDSSAGDYWLGDAQDLSFDEIEGDAQDLSFNEVEGDAQLLSIDEMEGDAQFLSFDEVQGGPSNVQQMHINSISTSIPAGNQAFLRDYWAAKKRAQRSKERHPTSALGLREARSRKNICAAVARCWRKQTVGIAKNEQKEIFRQLLDHQTFSLLQPSNFSKVEDTVVSGVRNTLTQIKVPHSASELFVKRSSLAMILNNSTNSQSVNQSRMASILGIHRRNIAAASSRLENKDEDEVLPLSACERQLPRGTVITNETRDLVYAFWTSESRVSPNKKDICKMRIGRKSVVKHPIHLLDESQVELYQRFKKAHPTVVVSLRCFEALKPYFVRKLKDRNTCCCVVHVQMLYFKEALNQMRQNKFGHHGKGHLCTCSVCCRGDERGTCFANQAVCQHITVMWESIMCPKPPNCEYHAKKCLMGDCSQCGVRRLTFCPDEIAEDSKEVSVKVFMEVGTGQVHEGGSEKKRKDLIVQRMKSGTFLSLFSAHLIGFIRHNFVFRWQAQQFKDCLQNFPSNVVVSVIDFAENYSFKVQNEIQSMHWWSTQVTILVHITYLRNAAGGTQKTLHFYISDDKQHDTLFVQHCFLLHDKWLKERGHSLQQHWVWSDGAASQFKARRPYYFVARYYQMTGLHMMHNFSASGHGKGEHDGAGAVIKRTLTHEELKPDGWRMKCAADVVNFLKATFQPREQSQRCNTQRVFWLIGANEVQRNLQWDCERIVGSRSFHCADGYSQDNRTAIRFRSLSCFCDPCMRGLWRRCRNRMHIEEWKYVCIKPLPESGDTIRDDESDDEEEGGDSTSIPMSQVSNLPLYEGCPEMLSGMLSIGDNFAVKAAEANEDFYIIKCTEVLYQTVKAQKDKWHNKIVRGGKVVEGFFYGQVEGKADTYRLLDHTSPVMIYSHLVRAIRFPMEPIAGSLGQILQYKLSTEVYERIYNSMPYHDDESDEGASMLLEGNEKP